MPQSEKGPSSKYLHHVTVASVRARPTDRAALRSAAVAIVAFAVGVLTAYAQGWLPEQMGSLANSAGSWALVAFALSLIATSGWLAAVFGSASLLALLAGYLLGAQMQGFPSSTTTVVFWGAAALLAGPLLGLSAFWVKTRRDFLAAIGVGVMSGVIIGEGIYGLTRVADTTHPPYWWGEIVVGLISCSQSRGDAYSAFEPLRSPRALPSLLRPSSLWCTAGARRRFFRRRACGHALNDPAASDTSDFVIGFDVDGYGRNRRLHARSADSPLQGEGRRFEPLGGHWYTSRFGAEAVRGGSIAANAGAAQSSISRCCPAVTATGPRLDDE